MDFTMKFGILNFFCLCSFFNSYAALLDSGCVVAPLECPNQNISFWMYTRANQYTPVQLNVTDPQSIKAAPWVNDAPIKVLIHGYTGHKDFSPNTEIRPAYMECCNYNVISVDYNNLALEPCYVQAARNTKLVGMCTAELIDFLVQNYSIPLSRFHIVGFSLGGQTAGFISNYLKSGKLSRITALDPALPLFATNDNNKKIDRSDAQFVDVTHTNGLMKGKLEPSGHKDFYPNGGLEQPGCTATKNHTKSSCDHTRAVEFYAESINTRIGFYAIKCNYWLFQILGWCDFFNTSEETLFGEYTPKEGTGSYFFNTNPEPPYARGSRNSGGHKKY